MSLFPMNSGRARVRLLHAGATLAVAAFAAGCGNNYRPVVTPINPSGPAAQPTSYAVVVSSPSPSSAGIVTVLDYSGDTVMAIAPIGPGPRTFSIDQRGSVGYTVNSDGTLANFPISTTLQAKNVTYSTLGPDSNPLNLMSPTAGLWATDLTGNNVKVFALTPASLKYIIPVPPTPITIVGSPTLSGPRQYVVSQNFTDSTGMACNTAPAAQPTGVITPIETQSYSTDPSISVGKCPVYAIPSSDSKRIFVVNRGSDTVSVINGDTNALNQCTPFVDDHTGRTVTCHPTLPLSTSAVTATSITPPNGTSGMPATAEPVYAEYNAATSQLVVADYASDTISVIDVSLDQYGNDSTTFGTTYTIPVGKNPASVTVLYDGSRAYTANQGDSTVTIANLSSHSVEKTLTVLGHPRTVVSTQNSLYGKVYVASPDSPYVTILSVATDLVDTTILVQGNVVDVRASTQNGSSGNANVTSRTPGYGQVCNLPGIPAPSGTQTALEACQAIP